MSAILQLAPGVVVSALGMLVLSVQVANCQYHAPLQRALQRCVLLLQVLPILVQDHVLYAETAHVWLVSCEARWLGSQRVLCVGQ